MDMQSTYWVFFNFMVRRVVAVLFAVIGGLMALFSLPALLDPNGTTLVNGQPEPDLFYRLVAVALPAAMSVCGVLLYRVPPFVPSGRNR
jgi:hypothetical protein